MGRGLSPLQRWMLMTALANKVADEETGSARKTHLYNAEVYCGWYGWTPYTMAFGHSEWRRPTDRSYVRQHPADQHYRLAEIGHAGYATVTNAVARASRRLVDRGLMEIVEPFYRLRWVGMCLTDEGVLAAIGLESAPRAAFPSVTAGVP